jgi:hypothetical protein
MPRAGFRRGGTGLGCGRLECLRGLISQHHREISADMIGTSEGVRWFLVSTWNVKGADARPERFEPRRPAGLNHCPLVERRGGQVAEIIVHVVIMSR